MKGFVMEDSKAKLDVIISKQVSSVPENCLVSTSQADKKKICVETMSSS